MAGVSGAAPRVAIGVAAPTSSRLEAFEDPDRVAKEKLVK